VGPIEVGPPRTDSRSVRPPPYASVTGPANGRNRDELVGAVGLVDDGGLVGAVVGGRGELVGAVGWWITVS